MENLKVIDYDHRGNRTYEQEKEQELKFENSLLGLKDEFIELEGFVQIEYNEKNSKPKIQWTLNNGDIGSFIYRINSQKLNR